MKGRIGRQAAQAAPQPVEGEIDHRRREERQHLAHDQAAHDGEAEAESFTIQPGKDGETATLVARVGNARVLANSYDPAICAELRGKKVNGRPVRIEPGEGEVNRFRFV